MQTTSDSKTKNVNWNLTSLLNDDKDPKANEKLDEVKKESYKFINKWKDRDDYLTDPAVLKTALDEYEHWCANYGVDGDVGYYYWLRTQQDSINADLKAAFGKVQDQAEKISNDINFFTHRIAKIPATEQSKFLNYKDLNEYKHFLEQLFANAKYLLTEDQEKIMLLKARPAHNNWIKMLVTLHSKEEAKVITEEGQKEVKTLAEIYDLTMSQNKKVRDMAANKFNSILEKHIDVAENEMNSILQNKKVDDELRGLKRPDEARHVTDDIDSEVVDVMLDCVVKRYNISNRYYELRAKLEGAKKLKYHERNIKFENIDKKYPYEEAVNIIKNTFKNLDPEFLAIYEDFINEGRFDVYPYKGKRDGAFCVDNLKSQPIYVMLNHTNSLKAVLTIAHEMGHAINDVFKNREQNALNNETTLAVAEVASTFMEDYVIQELAKSSSDELRFMLLVNTVNRYVTGIQRQVACYRFEQELHCRFNEEGYLSKERIGEIFVKHMSTYMGPAIDQKQGGDIWWTYWTHVRMFFYVYSYASGLLISKALQNKVKEDPANIELVKQFYKAGTSKSPKDIFADIGIDITSADFWNRGLDEIEQLLNETWKLAKKLGKI